MPQNGLKIDANDEQGVNKKQKGIKDWGQQIALPSIPKPLLTTIKAERIS
jgi:hypothetical protein